MNWYLFILAAASGGYLRYNFEHKLQPVGKTGFPTATLTVNLVGAFLLGLVFAAPTSTEVVLGVAFCGALTTFSGFSAQLMRRVLSGSYMLAFYYIVTTLIGGLGLAELGLFFGQFIFG